MTAPDSADDLLGHAERLRRRAHADRRGTSLPLLVFGVLSLAYPLVSADLYWMAAGPLGFLVLALLFRRRVTTTGVGSGRGVAAVVAGVLLAVLCLSPVIGGPTLATAAGLAILAGLQANRVLLGWAAGFAVVMSLAGSGLLNGAAGRYGIVEILVVAAFGAGMTAAGARALSHERSVR